MAIQQDDKKPIQEGRKNVLKDIDASLRDQIPAKLLKKLNELEIGRKQSELWSKGSTDRAQWLERQAAYLDGWDEFLVHDPQELEEGFSQLHLPVSFIVCKTYHARMLQALLSADPGVRPRRPDSVESAAMVQELLSYTLNKWANKNNGVEDILDAWLWNWITTGTGLVKWRWDCEYTRFLDVEEVRVPGPPKLLTTPDGTEISVPTQNTEEHEVMRTEKVFEGPVLEWLFPEDCLILGGDGSIERADAVMHRQMLTASQLWSLVDRKILEEDVVEELIKGGPSSETSGHNTVLKNLRSLKAGMLGPDTDSDLDRYEVLESYIKVDVDGSGITSDIVVWTSPKLKKVMRATYLRRMHKSGRIPIFKIDFHKRPGQPWGMGLPEILHPLTKEMDMIHNMRIDWGLMSTMPVGFYRPSASIEKDVIKYQPGSLIPLDNPQTDIMFPNMGNRTFFGQQEEQNLQTIIERLTGISDLNLGVLSGQQGATRTATGARALVTEANLNLNVHISRMIRGWTQALEFLVHMLQQRLPRGFSFRITGEDGADYFAKIFTAEQIRGDFDFEIIGDSSQSNPTIQVQQAQQILQLTADPIGLQVGINNAGHLYEAKKNLLKAMGRKDWSRFISKPPQHQIILTPEDEINRIARGQEVPVLPQSDHEGYLTAFEHIMKTDELLGQFDSNAAVRLAAQAKKHQQMLQALQQQQAQVANQQQMVMNAQAGQAVSSGGTEQQ